MLFKLQDLGGDQDGHSYRDLAVTIGLLKRIHLQAPTPACPSIFPSTQSLMSWRTIRSFCSTRSYLMILIQLRQPARVSTYQRNFVCNSSSSYITCPDHSEARNITANGVTLKSCNILGHLRRVYESDRFIGTGVLEFIPETIQGRFYFDRAIFGLKAGLIYSLTSRHQLMQLSNAE